MLDAPARPRKNAVATTMAILRRLARAGYTRREAAAALNLNYYYVCMLVRKHGAPFRQGSQKETVTRPRVNSPIQRIKSSGILADMTEREKLDTLTLIRKGHMTATEALLAVKRPDLAARVGEFL